MRQPKVYMHRGLPVPYAALWSAEHEGIGAAIQEYYARNFPVDNDSQQAQVAATRIGEHLMQVYPDDFPFTVTIDGVRWLKPRDLRGRGEPLFGELHATRQRSCMLKGLCQVCGLPVGHSPLLWVTHMPVDLYDPGAADALTSDAPTCEDCRQRALSLCPALRERTELTRMYRVRTWEVWGARTRMRDLAGSGPPRDIEITLSMEALRQPPVWATSIAGQAVTRFIDYEEIEL